MKFTLLFLFSFATFAQSFTIQKIKGDVYQGKVKLTQKSQLKDVGEISTGEKSFIKVKGPDYILTITPNSKVNIQKKLKAKAKNIYGVVTGTLRWFSVKTGINQSEIYTNNAIFGVRGTDFITVYNPLLDESEIIVLDGKVHLQSKIDKKDSVVVNKGQWGGLGGRYTQKIGDLIDLPKSVLDTFDGATSF